MQNGTFIRVFVASPGDVHLERDEACRVIHNWNAAHSISRSVLIEPVRVETHSHAVQGGHPQDLINGQLLNRCDLLVAILWSRLGTPTNSDLSGTVQEIREFAQLKGADRILVFFCDRAIPSSSDLEQVQAVRSFKDSIKTEGLYTQYTEVPEFGSLFRHQLDLAMNRVFDSEEFSTISNISSEQENVTLLSEANTILAAAIMADRTTVTLGRMMAGHELHAGNVELNIMGDDRSEARWEAGLEQVERFGFVEDLGHKREVFRLTRAGFDLADQLWFILLLRRVELYQKDVHGYVDFQQITQEPYFGQQIKPTFAREKLQTLASMQQIEIVPVDGGIGAARLSDRGRKTLREQSALEFAEPEGSEN